MEITYTKCGDYLLPNLILKPRKQENLNKYGLMRLDYLKKNKSALYQQLLMQDKLYDHLFSVSIDAEDKVNYLINENRIAPVNLAHNNAVARGRVGGRGSGPPTLPLRGRDRNESKQATMWHAASSHAEASLSHP